MFSDECRFCLWVHDGPRWCRRAERCFLEFVIEWESPLQYFSKSDWMHKETLTKFWRRLLYHFFKNWKMLYSNKITYWFIIQGLHQSSLETPIYLLCHVQCFRPIYSQSSTLTDMMGRKVGILLNTSMKIQYLLDALIVACIKILRVFRGHHLIRGISRRTAECIRVTGALTLYWIFLRKNAKLPMKF